MQLRKLSFKIKLILLLEIFVILINSLLGFFIWKQLSYMIREVSRKRLVAIASTTANLIDAQLHEQIITPEDEEKAPYQGIKETLKKIKTANDEVDDIYTLRKTDQENLWTFALTAKDEIDENLNGIIDPAEEKVAIGEEFDSTDCPQLEEAIAYPTADYDINCDKWGCWLSGYAPIKDGKDTVAVVGVDVSAQDIVNFEKEAKIIILSVLFGLIILFPILLYFFIDQLVKPISKIIEGLRNFSHNLSSRIKIKTGDEFEVIANTFNKMAKELQELYDDLEGKVKEKTKALNEKLNELEMEKSKDDALLSSIGEGMIATDKKGKIIITNPQAEKLLGYEAKELLGKNYVKTISLADEKGVEFSLDKRPINSILKNGEKISAPYYYIRKDSARIPVYITASPVMINKKIIGSIIVFRDITKEKEIDKAKSEFVSLASHQLRTPLSSINWYTELLLGKNSDNLTDKQKKYLGVIADINHQMVELVNCLLNVSRIEMGTFAIESKEINIEEIATSVLKEMAPQLKEKAIKLKYNDTAKTKFLGDAKLLRIVFQNLLTNAIKYTPAGGEITLNIFIEKENLYIEVKDNGYGIPQNQQERIFSKLFRADNIKDKETTGTGLGLYIVKSIIDNSGGKISFHSEENKGTTFTISFPLWGMKSKNGEKELN